MSFQNLIGGVDLFSNPIEEEEAIEAAKKAAEEARRKAEEAAKKAREQAEEQARKMAEQAKEAAEGMGRYKGPERQDVKVPRPEEYKTPEQKQPENPNLPKPENYQPPDQPVKKVATDGQNLNQQTPQTRAAFEARYGEQAQEEWVREHEAELQRNIGTYGKPEPEVGSRGPSGTADPYPDRTIGAQPWPTNTPAGESRAVINPSNASPSPSTMTPTNPLVEATKPPTPPAPPTSTGTRDPNTIAPSSFSAPARLGDDLETTTQSVMQTSREQLERLVNRPEEAQAQVDSDYQNTLPANQMGSTPTPLTVPPAPGAAAPQAPTPPQPPTPGTQPTPPAGMVFSEPMPTDGKDYVYVQDRNGSFQFWTPRQDAGMAGRKILFDPKTAAPTSPDGLLGQPETGSAVMPREPGMPLPTQPRQPKGVTTPGIPADPYRMAANTTQPINSILELTGRDPKDSAHILNGISALMNGNPEGAWTEPYLNDVARLAWAKEEESNGRNSDPRDAPLEYLENWKDAYFGSDTNVPFVRDLDQQMIDFGVQKAQATNKPFSWKDAFGETGENGLISRQIASNDCGPNAFATVLRSKGYNLDPATAFQYAKQKGYHNGSEFTGPQNFARMLQQEAGIDARATGVDWNVINQELDAGRVVVLSSPGHYWTVSARREGPRGTEYFAGETAAVVGNPEWGRAGQFAYGGAPNTMITHSGDPVPNAPAVVALGLKPPAVGTTPNRGLLSTMTLRQRASNTINTQASRDPAVQLPVQAAQPPIPAATPAAPVQAMRAPVQTASTGSTVRLSNNEPYIEQPGNVDPNARPTQLGSSAQGATPPPAQAAPRVDPRVQAATQENLWSNNQTNRQTLMQEWQARPVEERRQEFETAMDRGLDAEGITNPGDRERWKAGMRGVVMGEGIRRRNVAENPDLNPYMIAGESGGRPGTASRLNSAGMGYFQFLHQNPDGSLYSHDRFRPDEYKEDPYNPTGQVRQFIRAINGGKYKGDPMGPVRQKEAEGHWGP